MARAATAKKPAAKPVAKATTKAAVKPQAKATAKPTAKSRAGATEVPARRKPASSGTAARVKPVAFAAPDGFKPFFLELEFATSADGFVAPAQFSLEAIRGKLDNEKAPRVNLIEQDADAAIAVIARFLMITYAPNVTKRLPAGKRFNIVFRVAKNKDGDLRCTVKEIHSVRKNNYTLMDDRADPIVRRFRRVAKFLMGGMSKMAPITEYEVVR